MENIDKASASLHGMNFFAELSLIILITMIFIFIAKIISSIKIKGKKIKIPVVIVVVVTGFLTGIILRAIDPEFSFSIVPHFSMISVILLFIAFGSMIDFKAFKKFGKWTIILGTIPYLIELLVLTLIITLLTNLLWFEAGIVAVLLAMCAPGVVSTNIMGNILKGYEKGTNYNETVSLAGAIENITGIILMIVLVVVYMGHYSGAGIGVGVTIALPIVLLTIGFVLGIMIGALIVYVIKPVAKLIINPYKNITEGLEGEELKIAMEGNQKQEKKSNILVWIILFAIIAGIYFIMQLLFGIGFIVMESGLVAGIFLSYLGSKSISIKKTQGVIAQKSNVFYIVLGSFIVWGFGGMLINPADLVGNDWIVGVSIPNIISAFIFIFFAMFSRIVGIFVSMFFNKEYTFKQKLYTIPVMLSTGTSGVNNGVTILLILGVSAATPSDQLSNALLLQSIMIVTGTIMTFILIPIGTFILNWTQDKLIFQWGEISEGKYNALVNKAIKEESKNNSNIDKSEINSSVKQYWNSFYMLKKVNSNYQKSFSKETVDPEWNITKLSSKIEKINLNSESLKFDNEEKINSMNIVLNQKIISLKDDELKIKEATKKNNGLIEELNLKLNSKLKDNNSKLKEFSKELNEHKTKLNSILELQKAQEEPDYLLDAKNKYNEDSINLKKIISKSLNNNDILNMTNNLTK